MTWLDILILILLTYGLIVGLFRGLIKEILAIASVILGFIGAKMFGITFSLWLHQQFLWVQSVCEVLAYALIFIGIVITLNLIALLLGKLAKAIHLSWLNRLLGGMFGILKWGVIVLLIVFCINTTDKTFNYINPDLKNDSPVYSTTCEWADALWNNNDKNINIFIN